MGLGERTARPKVGADAFPRRSRHNSENHGETLFVNEALYELARRENEDDLHDADDGNDGDAAAAADAERWRKLSPRSQGEFSDAWLESHVLPGLSEGAAGPVVPDDVLERVIARAPVVVGQHAPSFAPCSAVLVKPVDAPNGYLLSPGNCVATSGDGFAQVVVPLAADAGATKFLMLPLEKLSADHFCGLVQLRRPPGAPDPFVSDASDVWDRVHVVPHFCAPGVDAAARASRFLVNTGRWIRHAPVANPTAARVVSRPCPTCGEPCTWPGRGTKATCAACDREFIF